MDPLNILKSLQENAVFAQMVAQVLYSQAQKISAEWQDSFRIVLTSEDFSPIKGYLPIEKLNVIVSGLELTVVPWSNGYVDERAVFKAVIKIKLIMKKTEGSQPLELDWEDLLDGLFVEEKESFGIIGRPIPTLSAPAIKFFNLKSFRRLKKAIIFHCAKVGHKL